LKVRHALISALVQFVVANPAMSGTNRMELTVNAVPRCA
jgi:hypothetical protein